MHRNDCLALHFLTQRLADIRVVGDHFCNNIRCALQGILNTFHALFRIDIVGSKGLGILSRLGKNCQRQRFQTLLLGHSCPGTAFLLIGAVQILRLCQGSRCQDLRFQFLGQLSLPFNGTDNLLLALGQIAQVLQPGLQGSQCGIIHAAVEFFPIPGNEGNGVSLIQKLHNIFYIFFFLLQLETERCNNIFHSFLLSFIVNPLYHKWWILTIVSVFFSVGYGIFI